MGFFGIGEKKESGVNKNIDVREILDNEYSRDNWEKARAAEEVAIDATYQLDKTRNQTVYDKEQDITRNVWSGLVEKNESIKKTEEIYKNAYKTLSNAVWERRREVERELIKLGKRGHDEAIALNKEYDELLKKEEEAMKVLQQVKKTIEDFENNKLKDSLANKFTYVDKPKR